MLLEAAESSSSGDLDGPNPSENPRPQLLLALGVVADAVQQAVPVVGGIGRRQRPEGLLRLQNDGHQVVPLLLGQMAQPVVDALSVEAVDVADQLADVRR